MGLKLSRIGLRDSSIIPTEESIASILTSEDGLPIIHPVVGVDFRDGRLVPLNSEKLISDINATGVGLDIRDYLKVGETAEIYSETTGSNSSLSLIGSGVILRVLSVICRLQCGAAAANRTITLQGTSGGNQRGWSGANQYDWSGGTSGAIIANQYGSAALLGNGVRVVNINGTITPTAGISPFPMDMPCDLFTILGTIANIQAADLTGVTALVKRVA